MSARRHAPAALGLALGAATLPIHALAPHALSVQMAALALGAIGAIYAGFGLQVGGRAAVVECAIAWLFLSAAVIGLWVQPWAIPAAYVAHGVWDWAHHRSHGPALARIPSWYPPFCAVYDWIFAAGLTWIWLR